MPYTARPRSSYFDDGADLCRDDHESITVISSDQAQPTGLLNQHGDELYRVPERVRIGFHVR